MEEEEEEVQSDVNSSGDRQGTYVSRERSLLRGKGGSRRVSIEDKKRVHSRKTRLLCEPIYEFQLSCEEVSKVSEPVNRVSKRKHSEQV